MTAQDLLVYSGLASFAVTCFLGAFVFVKNRQNPANVFFGVFALSIGIWSIGSSLENLIEDEHSALMVLRTCYLSGVFLPALFLHFAYYLTGRIHTDRKFLILAYVLSTLFAATVYTRYFIDGFQIIQPYDFRLSKPGQMYYSFLTYFFLLVLYVLVLIYAESRKRVGLKSRQLRYIFYAHVVAAAAGLDYFLSVLHVIPYPPLDDYLLVVYFAVFAYGIARYHLMDITVALHEGLAYGLLFGVLIPAYLLILGLEWVFTGTTQYLLSGIVMTMFVICAGLLVNLQKRLHVAVGKALFPRQHNANDALHDFSTSMRNILDLRALTKRTVASLSEALAIRKISIFLEDEERDEYVLSTAYGFEETRLQAVTISSKELLPQYLQERGQAILKEELEQRGDTLGVFSKRIISMLENLDAELCLPLQNQGRLIGFINLGPKPNHSRYTQENLKNLSILASSAASAFANATFHQKEKNAQRREKHEERARAFETIAGGFAHEIRNPLVSINTFLALVPLRKDDPEFMEGFRQVVMNDSARIERLSGEVLGFARLHEPLRQDENLNDVVVSSLRAIEAKAQNNKVVLRTELAEDLPPVWIDSQQLRQVLANLYMNALDAMEDAGEGQMITKTCGLMKPDGQWAQIEITDSGIGMAPDTIDKIFVPFFTTKHESKEREGTGLGLPICQRIIVAHGGYIEVKSEIGKGTTFLITLPVRAMRD